jgi:hypothetical protein
MRKLIAAGSLMLVLFIAASGLRADQPAAGAAPADLPQRMELARQLTKSDSIGKVQDQIIGILSKQFTDMMVEKNPKKEKEIRELMSSAFGELSARKGEVMEKVAEIYARHFEYEELKQILAFKQSPVGQKMDAELPGIMQESLLIGQRWGQEVGQEALRRFLEKAKGRGLDL